MEKQRKKGSIAIGFVSIILTGVICFVSFYVFTNYAWIRDPDFKEVDFVSENWKSSDYRTKGTMIQSLLDTTELNGMSKDAVMDLLGHPDSTHGGFVYTMDIGTLLFGSPWLYHFKIEFNPNDTVVYYKLDL